MKTLYSIAAESVSRVATDAAEGFSDLAAILLAVQELSARGFDVSHLASIGRRIADDHYSLADVARDNFAAQVAQGAAGENGGEQ